MVGLYFGASNIILHIMIVYITSNYYEISVSRLYANFWHPISVMFFGGLNVVSVSSNFSVFLTMAGL